ncbi:hypothetical protein OEZ86_000807 [Tetradesmus obliquus]|nr:hypothetical protein OEZ86_000807 [Tetradesmus obliquus]
MDTPAELIAKLGTTGPAAAALLSRLWKQSAHAKLLQRPPADNAITKHQTLFQKTQDHAVVLELCLDQVLRLQPQGDDHAEQFLQAVLAARPVATLARLLVWLQQRPELLQLPEQAAEELTCGLSYGTVWMPCCKALSYLLQLVCEHSTNTKLLLQPAEELVSAGLPQQLPGFIWQAVQILAAAGQPLCNNALGRMQQMQQLWASGQWQQPMQLLQQGGGQVLLQGLTLAVHSSSLSSELGAAEGMALHKLLTILQPSSDRKNAALQTRMQLFVSQLARKHPVPFFQFLDACARSRQRDAIAAWELPRLLQQGAAKIGTKGLVDLLSSPAAAAALGSALCSIMKVRATPVSPSSG